MTDYIITKIPGNDNKLKKFIADKMRELGISHKSYTVAETFIEINNGNFDGYDCFYFRRRGYYGFAKFSVFIPENYDYSITNSVNHSFFLAQKLTKK